MINLLLPLFIACGETISDYPLTQEFYEWDCHDFEDFTEVKVRRHDEEQY